MAHKKMHDRTESKAITVRVSPEEYETIKEYADSRKSSLNTVVGEAIAQYGAKVQRQQAIQRIHDLQREFREAGAVDGDSTQALRQLRLERAERLAGIRPSDNDQEEEPK